MTTKIAEGYENLLEPFKLGRYMPVFDGLFFTDWIRVLLEEIEAYDN